MPETTDSPLGPDWTRRGKTALLFAWLLITICAYYILRPVRMALVLSDFGPKMLPWVYMGTALFTGLAVWAYSQFTHLPRRRLLTGVITFFLSNFAGLWWMIHRGSSWSAPVLYVWTDIFSIMSPTLFWMYANDVLAADEAKATFGKIGAAGMVGAFVGAGLTKTLVAHLGVSAMMLVAGAVYGLTLACFLGLEWLTGGKSAARAKSIEKFDDKSFGDFRSVVKNVLASPTLTLLVIVVSMERFVPDFVDYIFSSAMHNAFPERAAYAGAFATFELWRNALVFLGTFFLTSKILKRGGVHVGLTAVPATIVLVGGFYAVLPALAVAIALKGLEEGQRHAWFKAGKEVVYTATSKEVIYKVKAYIEMFVYRLARGAAGLLLLVLTDGFGFGPRGVAVAMLPLAAIWGWATWTLGTSYERMNAQKPAAKPEPETAHAVAAEPAKHAVAA